MVRTKERLLLEMLKLLILWNYAKSHSKEKLMKILMNPKTGSIASKAEWQADAKKAGWEFEAAELIEVKKINGEWVEKE